MAIEVEEMCRQQPLQSVLGQIIILAHNLDLSLVFLATRGKASSWILSWKCWLLSLYSERALKSQSVVVL